MAGLSVTARRRWLTALSLAVLFGYVHVLSGERVRALFPFLLFHIGCWIVFAWAMSRRVLFSFGIVAALLLLLTRMSAVKQRLLGTPLYWGDLFYYARRSLLEVIAGYWQLVLVFLIPVVAAGWVMFAVVRLERPVPVGSPLARRGRWGLLALPLSLTLLFAGQPQGDRLRNLDSWNHMLNTGRSRITAFLASFSNMRATLPDVPAPQPDNPFLREAVAAEAKGAGSVGRLPDVFIVLEESTFNPQSLEACAQYPEYCRAGSKLFAPDANTISWGNLLVHIFGGSSWLSEFAVATGLPHYLFGPGGMFATYSVAPRVQHSVYRQLRTLGYGSMVIYPMSRHFINAGHAYAAYGIENFQGTDELGLSTWQVSDRQIFEHAMTKYREAKRSEPDRPLLMFISTMRQHGPHEDPRHTLSPAFREFRIPGLSEEGNLSLANYFDRLQQSADAIEWLDRALVQEGRPAALLHFGDHLPGFVGGAGGVQIRKGAWKRDPRRVTYYRIHGYGLGSGRARNPRQRELLDVAFVGTELLDAAGVPLGPYLTATRRLRDRCDGVFACDQVPGGEKEYADFLAFAFGGLGVVR